jgi:hypothetical protein
LRRLSIAGDGLIAVLGVLALKAMGATWTAVVLVAVAAAACAVLIIVRALRRDDRHSVRGGRRARLRRPPAVRAHPSDQRDDQHSEDEARRA